MLDLSIIGAGPVGATLALLLADADLDVAVLDARPAGGTLRSDRSLALSHGSRLILDRVGVWGALAATPGAATPIREIDVSQAGGFGVTRLRASDVGLPALGYVVSYVALQNALDAALVRAGVHVRFATAVREIEPSPDAALVHLAGEGGETIVARLAAVADGTGTSVTGMTRERHAYGQSAVVASIRTEAPHEGVAYERFTASGPIALLPEHERYGLVWTMPPAEADRAIAMPDADFLRELHASFGRRVRGFVRVLDRRAFALALEVARPAVGRRIVALGNAAQTLHPVAGQGFNLGLRDARELAQAVLRSAREAIGAPAMLAEYAASRRGDRTAGIAFTHGLVQLFGTDAPFVRWPRGMALAVLDALPPAKRAFTRAMLFGLR
jgi:2-octaprenyl-6-methoxyphenol hydroxylase